MNVARSAALLLVGFGAGLWVSVYLSYQGATLRAWPTAWYVALAIACVVLLLVLVFGPRRVRGAESATEVGEGEEDTVSVPGGAPGGETQAQPSAATVTTPVAVPPTAQPAALSDDQLGKLRETLVAANPSAVPELIAGKTFDELVGSVEGANKAGAEFARRLNVQTAGLVVGGGGPAVEPSVIDGLSPEAKISYALGQKQGN